VAVVSTLAPESAAAVSASARHAGPTIRLDAARPRAWPTLRLKAGRPTVLRIENPTMFTAAFHVDAFDVHTVVRRGETFVVLAADRPGTHAYRLSMAYYRSRAGFMPGSVARRVAGRIVVEP
jgi:hypothetical protein